MNKKSQTCDDIFLSWKTKQQIGSKQKNNCPIAFTLFRTNTSFLLIYFISGVVFFYKEIRGTTINFLRVVMTSCFFTIIHIYNLKPTVFIFLPDLVWNEKKNIFYGKETKLFRKTIVIDKRNRTTLKIYKNIFHVCIFIYAESPLLFYVPPTNTKFCTFHLS